MAQTTKIMLVEDDNNLGEIYMARMAAEGYSVVVAHDGEEALALAAKEKPDLIISDVMMPKISGFEMLDILRNTPGLRDTKVIMLTALGQAEDKTRAQSLGADRYLVKSQVTLEDIVENARALLSGGQTSPQAQIAPAAPSQPAAAPASASATVAAPASTPVAIPAAPATSAAAPESAPASTPPAANPIPAAPADPPAATPAAPAVIDPMPVAEEPGSNSVGSLAEPLNASPKKPEEEAKTMPIAAIAQPAAPPPAQPVPPPAPPAPPVQQTPTTVPAVAQPAPAAPAQPTPAPAPPVSKAAAEASNEKVLTGAVDELLANVPQANADAATATTAQPVPPPTPPAPPPDNNPAPQSEKVLDSGGNDITTGDNDSVRVANKKVIRPINDVTKKPDLNALLATEEAKNSAAAAPQPASSGPGITTSTNGLQTTVVMPSGADITGVTTTPTTSPPGKEAVTEPTPPGSQNPNAAPAPTTNFDPNSVAL